MNIKRGTIASH